MKYRVWRYLEYLILDIYRSVHIYLNISLYLCLCLCVCKVSNVCFPRLSRPGLSLCGRSLLSGKEDVWSTLLQIIISVTQRWNKQMCVDRLWIFETLGNKKSKNTKKIVIARLSPLLICKVGRGASMYDVEENMYFVVKI